MNGVGAGAAVEVIGVSAPPLEDVVAGVAVQVIAAAAAVDDVVAGPGVYRIVPGVAVDEVVAAANPWIVSLSSVPLQKVVAVQCRSAAPAMRLARRELRQSEAAQCDRVICVDRYNDVA